MASPRVGSVPPKMSFAKVRTCESPPGPKLTKPPQVAAMNVPHPSKASHNISEEKKLHSREPTNRRGTVISPKPQVPSPPLQTTPQPTKAEVTVQVPETNDDGVAIEGLSLVGHILPTASGLRSAESAESVE